MTGEDDNDRQEKKQRYEDTKKQAEQRRKKLLEVVNALTADGSDDNTQPEQQSDDPADDSNYSALYGVLKKLEDKSQAKLLMLNHWHKLPEAERQALLRHHDFPATDFLIDENLTHKDKYWAGASIVLAKVPWNYNMLEINQTYFVSGGRKGC